MIIHATLEKRASATLKNVKKQDMSGSEMAIEALRQIADEEKRYSEAQQGMLEDLERGYDLGTHGKIGWTRDDLHER